MLGKGLGGIEQCAIDYAEALLLQGHEVMTIIHPEAQIREVLDEKQLSYEMLSNHGWWDIFAHFKLKKMVQAAQPDMILTHGNRAAGFAARLFKGVIPVVSVSHNYRFIPLLKADAILTLSPHMRDVLAEHISIEKLHIVHNMVRIPRRKATRPRANPPVIGTLGRFVPEKGYDIYIEALALLKTKGIEFQAYLGGGGELEEELKALADEYDLGGHLLFKEWIDDVPAFIDELDIFCLPSRSEALSITLLQALAAACPCVISDLPEPVSVVQQGRAAEIVPPENAEKLAIALSRMLKNEEYGQNKASLAQKHMQEDYSIEVVSEKLSELLTEILETYHRGRASINVEV